DGAAYAFDGAAYAFDGAAYALSGVAYGLVGRGFCIVYPPRPSDTPQEGNFGWGRIFFGCVWFLDDDGISSAGAVYS
ncbi:MAG TPA: hypothetical protein PLW09_06250, partial [Candidatus Kapabacteria bacterium]|nr:hypothetical protein [Candidatus Kapabacteria bacterium]